MSDGIDYELLRFRTRDGGETTVYLVRHPRARTRGWRLAASSPPSPRATSSRPARCS